MSRGLNRVELIGYLGADPEVRVMPSGKHVANMRLATHSRYKDKQTGEATIHTEWHNVVLFDRLAEIARDHTRSGSYLRVEGSLRTNKWQDKETKQDRYSTEIVGRDLLLLDSPKSAAAPDAGDGGEHDDDAPGNDE